MIVNYGGESEVTLAFVVSKRPFTGSWEYVLDSAIFTSPPTSTGAAPHSSGAIGKLLGVGSLIVRDATDDEGGLPGNMFVPDRLAEADPGRSRQGRPPRRSRAPVARRRRRRSAGPTRRLARVARRSRRTRPDCARATSSSGSAATACARRRTSTARCGRGARRAPTSPARAAGRSMSAKSRCTRSIASTISARARPTETGATPAPRGVGRTRTMRGFVPRPTPLRRAFAVRHGRSTPSRSSSARSCCSWCSRSMAKQILPWFGGSAAVWTTCLVFFQTDAARGLRLRRPDRPSPDAALAGAAAHRAAARSRSSRCRSFRAPTGSRSGTENPSG